MSNPLPNTMSTGIMVGLASGGRPTVPEWGLCLAALNYPLNTTVLFSHIVGMETGEAREVIAQQALENKAKYLFFLDDDVTAPPYAVRDLVYTLDQNGPPLGKTMVAGGIYCSRNGDSKPTPLVYQDLGAGTFWNWKKGDIFDVRGIGTGCMMVNTEVFRKLERPWFKTVDEQPRDGVMIRHNITDDLYFCEKVIQAGFEIKADGRVLCGHWDIPNRICHRMPEDSYPMLDTNPAVASAQKIDGFMSDIELRWLVEQAARRERIVEIGSFYGRSTRALALSTKGTVTAIDDWYGPRDVRLSDAERQGIWERFQHNIRDLGEKVKPLKMDYDGLPTLDLGFVPDMVFVDGDHDQEHVKRDLRAALGWMKQGGLLCGHDANWPGVGITVRQEIGDFTVAEGTTIWSKEINA